MYTLYYQPGACSLITHIVLRELNQPFRLVKSTDVSDYQNINPVGAVPALSTVSALTSSKTSTDVSLFREGVAILWYLFDQHEHSLLPASSETRRRGVENMLFANATMHPAYGRLFFISQLVSDESTTNQAAAFKQVALSAAASMISDLWGTVEEQLTTLNANDAAPFLGGQQVTVADIMLAVYSRWGQYFSVDIQMGPRTQRMLDHVLSLPNVVAAIAAEDEAG